MIKVSAYSKSGSLVCNLECDIVEKSDYTYRKVNHLSMVFLDKDRVLVGRAYVDTFEHPTPHEGYCSTISRSISIACGDDSPFVRGVVRLTIDNGKAKWSY